MGLKEMRAIARQAFGNFSGVRSVGIQHKLGDCPVGEISVIIMVSSVHRKDSIRAIEFCIHELKARVTIWKKEVYASRESLWKENE